MVSQRENGSQNDGSPRTLAAQGRVEAKSESPRDRAEATGPSTFLQRLLETNWAGNRRTRTSVAIRQGDLVQNPAGSGEQNAPSEQNEPSEQESPLAPVTSENAAGFNMDAIKGILRQIVAEELCGGAGRTRSIDERESARRREADEQNERRQRIDEELAELEERAKRLRTERGENLGSHSAAGTVDHPHPIVHGAHPNPGLLTAQTGGGFGISTTLGNTKFTISPPPRFNAKDHTWLIWKPRVLDYFVTIGLEGVLEPGTG
jgi:hypothetical protein